MMKITLLRDGVRTTMKQPYAGAVFVESVHAKCDACNAEPLQVRTDERVKVARDEVKGAAYCVACKAPAGELHVKFDTIFGLEEDDRVLNGRARVY